MAIIRDVIDLPGPVPVPRRLEPRWGRLDLHRGIRLETPAHASVGLRRLIRRHQQRFDGLLTAPAGGSPRLSISVRDDLDRSPRLGDDEAFTCRVTSAGAEVEAATPFGVSHALERFLQLVARDAVGPHLPAMRLEDGPHLPWRGLLLDLARHHLPLPALLRTLDGMAALGLNVLHLHLNDDQGFRIETPSCPELFERASGGRYLREAEVERLIADAAIRGIRVVPEFDVPGHAGAILWARPDLAAGEPPGALPRAFGPSRHALDPTREDTWALLDAVLGDLARHFDDPFVHIGGDEVHPEVYAFRDARRRDWCEARGLGSALDVQRWFVAEMVRLVERHDRRAVVWDEALAPQLPEDVVVQSWRGAGSLEAALEAGHDALSSSGYYLDLCYPARLHYAFDPASGAASLAGAEAALLAAPDLASVRKGIEALFRSVDGLAGRSGAARGRLLGGEACLWSELVTAELLDTRLYGRLAAVAERLWSEPERADVDDFYRRLPGFLAHLEAHTDCRPLTGCEPVLLRIGVRPDELHHVRVLLAALEPVRWYRRLLGARLATARGEGSGMGTADAERPYDADTLLQRPVDLLPPESLDVLRFEQELLAFGEAPTDPVLEVALRDRAHRWRMAQCSL
ncbi:MAG: family 20 glycosylhydrolase, partial [Pseudomonadales bacterium]|nr:family 20 glycosylhydrolase [Pseudomonadales bacterium]